MTSEVSSAYEKWPLTPLTLRVGVTGHRPNKLPEDRAPLEKKLSQIIDDIVGVVQSFRDRKEAELLYDCAEGTPRFTIVSSLAEGTDRLAAKAALDADFSLIVPLPFCVDEYKRDFASGESAEDSKDGTVQAFNDLLNEGKVIQLDGRFTDQTSRNQSYLSAGIFTVSHCDLLICVWDGNSASGIGGTANVVGHARRNGVPVVHILADKASIGAISILPPVEIGLPSASPQPSAVTYDVATLQEILERRFLPQSVFDVCTEELEEFSAEGGFRTDGPSPNYVDKGPLVLGERRRWLGGLFEFLNSVFVSRSYVDKNRKHQQADAIPLPASPDREAVDRFYAAFLYADQLATHYSRLNRSTFAAIYLLGSFAIAVAVAALVFKKGYFDFFGFALDVTSLLICSELVLLIAIGLLVRQDRKKRWHEKWLDYRLLAELLRPMGYLALIGATIPAEVVRHVSSQVLSFDDASGHKKERGPFRAGAWVFAYLQSVIRSAGVVSATFDEAYLARCKDAIQSNLIGNQLHYHDSNAIRNSLFDRRLSYLGTVLFFVTVGVVVLKLLLAIFPIQTVLFVSSETAALVFGLLAAALPAFAAATYAIRTHAELEIVARRSTVMLAHLNALNSQITDLSGTLLTTSSLAATIRKTADIMVHDVADWVDIFEVKEAEMT